MFPYPKKGRKTNGTPEEHMIVMITISLIRAIRAIVPINSQTAS